VSIFARRRTRGPRPSAIDGSAGRKPCEYAGTHPSIGGDARPTPFGSGAGCLHHPDRFSSFGAAKGFSRRAGMLDGRNSVVLHPGVGTKETFAMGTSDRVVHGHPPRETISLSDVF